MTDTYVIEQIKSETLLSKTHEEFLSTLLTPIFFFNTL